MYFAHIATFATTYPLRSARLLTQTPNPKSQIKSPPCPIPAVIESGRSIGSIVGRISAMCERLQLRVVQLTPPGRGAVATLLVEGPGAVELVESRFFANSGRPLKSASADQLVVGRFEFGFASGEEVVVRRRFDDSLELHCHGGHAAVAMIEKVMVEQGVRVVPWKDWLADHHEDPIVAAARTALAEARTQRTAAILLDQYHGALRRALEQIERAIAREKPQEAKKLIDAVLARADLGRHLVRPWRVVLAGSANVGKSSLINAILGYPRAIVHHAPGTTRDVLTANTAVDGWPIELADTAGLHGGEDAMAQAGAELARQKLSAAELVILVFDSSLGWSEADQALSDSWPEALVVQNKSDRPQGRAALAGSGVPGLATSALTGEGVGALVRAISTRLVPDSPPPGVPVPFTEEQIRHITRLGLGKFLPEPPGLPCL